MWAGRHFPPARCQWEGRTQDVVMRLEPSSHSKALPSSPPSLSCCSLRVGTLWNIPPSSNHRGNLRVPPAAAPGHRAGPQGSRARRGPAQGIQPGWSEGTAGSGCVRRLQTKSLLRVILTRAPAVLNHRAPRRPPTTPSTCSGVFRHRFGPVLAPGRGSHGKGGVPGGEEGPRTGDSPTWVTGVSPAPRGCG